MQRPKIYFGHPVSTYNTEQERTLGDIIAWEFADYEVENPNQPHHQEAYRIWKREKGNGMQYYFEIVLPQMSAGVFLPFEDGMWGAGIYGEATFLKQEGKPIYEISWDGECIAPVRLDPARALSIDATRERVYGKK